MAGRLGHGGAPWGCRSARSGLIGRLGQEERPIPAFINESRASGTPVARAAAAGAAP
jgi:hypothetical protein